MDLTTFKLMFSEIGQEALDAATQLRPREADYLRHFQNLEKRYPGKLAQAALETAILREEAGKKFPHAGQMYFSREALEQASPHPVSAYRAKRFQGFDRLLDLGCSIGSDTLNLANMAHTTGIDKDDLRLAMAHTNAAALGRAETIDFILSDLRDPLPINPGDHKGIFFDPGRRSGGRRIYSVREYNPPLEIISTWLNKFPALGVKVSPGVNKSEIANYVAELEFVSLGGELKEALLWFGPLKSAERRATILPGPYTLSGEERIGKLPLNEPLMYIYEPDPAVIRAGLVAQLGEEIGGYQLDADIAYLTLEKNISTPYARSWEVEDWLPFNLKRLREYLHARNVGVVTVKKRGSPLQPEELINKLRLSGDEERVLFLTHLDGAPITIICFSHRV